MKEVQLYKISSDKALIGDYQADFQIQHADLSFYKHIKGSSTEFLADTRIDVENVQVRRIARNGHEYYIAVTNEIWETLCYFDNPVTFETLTKDREKLKNDLFRWKQEAISMTRQHKRHVQTLKELTLWQRIRYVFTGHFN